MARDPIPATEERTRDADRSQSAILAAARDGFAEFELGGAHDRGDPGVPAARLRQGLAPRERLLLIHAAVNQRRGDKMEPTRRAAPGAIAACGCRPPPLAVGVPGLGLVGSALAQRSAAQGVAVTAPSTSRIRGSVEAPGFDGYSEGELFSTGNCYLRPHEELLDSCRAPPQRGFSPGPSEEFRQRNRRSDPETRAEKRRLFFGGFGCFFRGFGVQGAGPHSRRHCTCCNPGRGSVACTGRGEVFDSISPVSWPPSSITTLPYRTLPVTRPVE